MGRKKSIKKKEYEPSKYQKAIYDFIKNGKGNLVVEAAAGSGKTTTLIKSLDFIDECKNILLVAFNRDIVAELKKRVKGVDNVEVRTLHSLGYAMIAKNFNSHFIETDAFKYASYINSNIHELASFNTYKLGRKDYIKYIDNIKKYVDFARFYLCKTENDLEFIEERYQIEDIADEKIVAMKVLEWGKQELDTVDYTDMIWLPNELDLKSNDFSYDWIMLDEAQDMNKAQRELVLRCFKDGTRLCAFGDKNQAIYGFSGSDPESFDKLKSLPNTISLPLSICYRCAKNIVDFAQQLVPSIEENGDGRNGEIIYDVQVDNIQDGDMIICRNNAPLMQIYNSLIKMGKKAFIRGKDIGLNLKKLVKNTHCENLNADFSSDGVFSKLYFSLFETVHSLMNKCNIDWNTAMTSESITSKIDMINAIEVLSEGINTVDKLINKIDDVFSDKKLDGIALSTIHKAKGLEANNVYVACKSLMPSKSAKKGWEINQEHNLMYVAYTRAKDKLGFIDEKDFQKFDNYNSENLKTLKNIERKVYSIYGKKVTDVYNLTDAKEIIRNKTKIDFSKPGTKKVVLGTKSSTIKQPVKPKSAMEAVANNRKKLKTKKCRK